MAGTRDGVTACQVCLRGGAGERREGGVGHERGGAAGKKWGWGRREGEVGVGHERSGGGAGERREDVYH